MSYFLIESVMSVSLEPRLLSVDHREQNHQRGIDDPKLAVRMAQRRSVGRKYRLFKYGLLMQAVVQPKHS